MSARRPSRFRTGPREGLLAAGLGALVVLGALGLGACSNDGPWNTAFCRKVADADRLFRESDVSRLDEEAKAFAELRRTAPPELRSDVELLADVVDDLAKTVPSAASPEAGRDAVFARRAGDRERIEAAGRNLERYASETCGLTLNPAAGTAVPAGTAMPAGTAPRSTAPGTTR